MIIVCPQCESRYELDEDRLSNDGRLVRCVRCRAEWAAYPVPHGPDGLDDRPFVRQGQEHATALSEAAILPQTLSPPQPEPKPEPQERTRPDEPGAQLFVEAASTREARLPRPEKRASRRRRPGWRWGAAIAGLAWLVTLIGQREQVVRAAPGAASLYALAGLPVNLRGLDFESVRTTMAREGGVPVLVVEGSVRNIDRDTVSLPRLRLAIRDAKAVELYSWTAVLARGALEPGEATTFRSRLASPPGEGRTVTVRFALRDDMVGGPK
jgi:predicted Zn finger-like uncharacterized protein